VLFGVNDTKPVLELNVDKLETTGAKSAMVAVPPLTDHVPFGIPVLPKRQLVDNAKSFIFTG
jgi:hypothetical protein